MQLRMVCYIFKKVQLILYKFNMSLIKLVIYFLFSIAQSIKPENYANTLPEITNGTSNAGGQAELKNLLIKISGNIHTIEQGLKQSSLNSTLNSINNTASEELTKGMLGYVSKHTLTNFKNPKDLEKNVLEHRNSSDLEINSYNTTNNNSTSEIKMSLTNENEIKKKIIEIPLLQA
ncbi:Uncharacterized protein cpbgf_5001520 [Cryptosporidium parvum]|uniref:Uncharacterized protein n=1 Tax=Cryptosporidium parvum TaxID=5807 RepID=A0A7S7LG95_CRYPV|nr:Uncharacterized protein CPATCC_0023310 [Cryptosporidium parvum]WRK32296.1 Uncharacterized protein cpbgf_5001520 [Cryptosporidium parvum]|eukprot:QOY41585.1 hypothetical protein CPATCC_002154 [Cryptosporidium parvum]